MTATETIDPARPHGKKNHSFTKRLLRIFHPRWRQSKSETFSHATRRKIEWTCNFRRLYQLQDIVRASGQEGTEVRHATRISDNKAFVVKVRHKGNYSKPGAFNEPYIEQAWRECTELMLNMPSSECVASVEAAFEDEHAYYVVMEYVDGTDLFYIVQSSWMGNEELKLIVQQLLTALQDLHQAGIVHRDLKLENLVLTKDWKLKLVDFDDVEGWPKVLPEGSTRWICGTDQYIAPEAYAGQFSPSSDLFAAGVTLFAMLFGRFPFPASIFDDQPGENFAGCRKMEAIRAREENATVNWNSCFRKNVTVTPGAKMLCQSLMAPRIKDRIGSAAEALKHPWLTGAEGWPDSQDHKTAWALEAASQEAASASDLREVASWPTIFGEEEQEDNLDILDLEEDELPAPVKIASDRKDSHVPTEAPESSGNSFGFEVDLDSDLDCPAPPGWVVSA